MRRETDGFDMKRDPAFLQLFGDISGQSRGNAQREQVEKSQQQNECQGKSGKPQQVQDSFPKTAAQLRAV